MKPTITSNPPPLHFDYENNTEKNENSEPSSSERTCHWLREMIPMAEHKEGTTASGAKRPLHSIPRASTRRHTRPRNLKYLCETSLGSHRPRLTQTAHTVAYSPGRQCSALGGTSSRSSHIQRQRGRPDTPAFRLKTTTNHMHVELRNTHQRVIAWGHECPHWPLLRHSFSASAIS